MAEPFLLKLFTPYKTVFESKVEAVILPGEHGEFGVLYGHTRYASTVRPGILRYVADGKTHKYAISGGFAEVHDQGITVLADSMETPKEIDKERAQQAKKKAEEMLKKKAELKPFEIDRWESRLQRAQNRLKAAKLS